MCQAACKKIWPIILDGLDSLMISEVNYKLLCVWNMQCCCVQVILMCHFNEGGGAQLQYDITRNLIPLLAQYSGLKSSQIMMRCVKISNTILLTELITLIGVEKLVSC